MTASVSLRAAVIAALCPTLFAGPALSQEAGSTPAASPPDRLEEIIVTAQKRQQVLTEVPIAVTAFTGDSLQQMGARQLADFLQTAPGVGIVDPEGGQQTIQIRGVNSVYGDAVVGYYLDEMPFTLFGNVQVPDVRTYDLDRIEVLRGPQGTLYGDGSLGGTIRILTRDPDLDEMQVGAELDGSDTQSGSGNYAVRGMVNVPIAENVAAVRLVGSYEAFGGWIDDTATGKEDVNSRDITNYRGKVRWAPIDRLDMVFSVWHTKQDNNGTSNSLSNGTLPWKPDNIDTEYDLYGATIRYSFDSFDVISATSYMDYSYDSISQVAGVFEFDENTNQDTLTEELRFSSTGEGPFSWTGGFFYRAIDRDTFTAFPAFAFTQDLTLTSDSLAAFGEATYSWGPVDFTAGLRYFQDDRESREKIDPFLLSIIQSVDPSYTGRIKDTFDDWAPRFNIGWHPDDNWLAYLNVSKGFRTGQPQPAISVGLAILNGVEVPNGVDPETLWSYEVGLKGNVLDNRLIVELATYYNDWKNLQVPVDVGNNVRALVNGGDANSQGVEIAVSWLPIDGLTLTATGAWVDAVFGEAVPGINIQKDAKIPGVPERTYSGSATYRFPVAASMEGVIYGGVQYNSERTDTVNGYAPSDDITLLDMRLGVDAGRWSAYLYGSNLSNENGAIDVYTLGVDGPALRPRPRTFGMTLGVNF